MLDNPNEELKNPESAVEETAGAVQSTQEEDFEAFYSELLKEFGPQTQPNRERKKTSGQTKNTQANAAVQHSKKQASKKKKGVKGLVITLCLELAGIVGIILWWIFRIL